MNEIMGLEQANKWQQNLLHLHFIRVLLDVQPEEIHESIAESRKKVTYLIHSDQSLESRMES